MKLIAPILLAALSLSVVAPPLTAEENKLTLTERRALKEYQDGRWPAQLKAIQDAAGFEVPVEVNWDTLALLGQASRFNSPDFWENTIFGPLAAALKEVTKDAMGKDALKGSLKKIVILHDPKTAPASNYANGVTFAGGALTINFHPGSNTDGPTGPNYRERTKAIRAALEKGL